MTGTAVSDPDNLLSPANLRDPFPLYARLREEAPASWNDYTRSYLFTRFADVRAAFADPVTFSSQGGMPLRALAASLPAEVAADFAVGYRFFYGQIQAFDPPQHTVHRSLVAKAFSPRVVKEMGGRIEARVHSLIDAMGSQGQVDFVSAFAYPLPSLVIFDLLGVPEEHYATLRRSADAFARFVPSALARDAAALHEVAESLRETEVLLEALLAKRRKSPEADLLSALVTVREGSDSLGDPEIVTLCNFLLFAGHETTANLLAGSLLALLGDRRLWGALGSGSIPLAGLVEELLRYVSPVLSLSRVLTCDIERHGVRMKKGERVSLMVGAANHDPAQFAGPDELQWERERTPSLAFGHGIHFCVGATLARMEAEVSLRALATRLPDMVLEAHEPEYQPLFFLRALKRLPVRTA